MAFEIVWTERAINGFNEVVLYLKTHWTDKKLGILLMRHKNF